jgi:hypothetical protein
MEWRGGLFGFGIRLRQGYGGTRRFGSVTGFFKPVPSRKSRQNAKDPRSKANVPYFFSGFAIL